MHVKSLVHSKEPEENKIIKEANPEESRGLICLLRMNADHEHNRRVVAKRKGELFCWPKKDSKAQFFLKIMGHVPTAMSGYHCPL